MNNSLLIQLLKQADISENEVKIYFVLHRNQICTVQEIAQETGINRTTVYRYLEQLEEKGLIVWIIDTNGKKVQATDPENINLYIEKRKTNLESIQKQVIPILESLKLSKPMVKLKTQVRYFEGESGFRQMIWNTLQSKEVMRGYTIFRRRDFIDPKFEDKFELEWSARNLEERVITNESRLEYINKKLVKKYRNTIKIRIIPSNRFNITNDIMIYNDVISIASFENDTVCGVEIENHEMANTQKSLFEIVWDAAKDI